MVVLRSLRRLTSGVICALRGRRSRRPATMPSRARRFVRRLHDPRPPLHVLHIGKTGGTALKHALLQCLDTSNHHLLLHGHDVTLADIPRGERFMFVLRDPVDRFVSAFNSRLHRGRPRYDYPWSEEERSAFATFRTAEELAGALSSTGALRDEAERAMRSIGHLSAPYAYWLGDGDRLRARRSDVFFIGFQERLGQDFDALKRKLELPDALRLPEDDVLAYRAPKGAHASLSEEARANLERWYARDRALVDHCAQLAAEVGAEAAESVAQRRRTPRVWPALAAAAAGAWVTRALFVDRYNPKLGLLVPGASWLWLAALSIVAAWALVVASLFVSGQKEHARAIGGFVPDCAVLVRRLLAEDGLARRYKLLLVLLVGYLAMPIDPVPDVIPIVGQLDDLVVSALVFGVITRAIGAAPIRRNWPGPQSSLRLVLRVAAA